MKKLIRLTESDLHRIVKESVNRVLREGKYRSGYIPRDGMTGGAYYSYEIDGETVFPYEDYIEWLFENYLIDKESESMGPECEAVKKYFKEHEDELVLYATYNSGEDESTNSSWSEVEPDSDCLEIANKCIQNCPFLNDEAKEDCIRWNKEFFNDEGTEYKTYTWEELDYDELY